MSARPNATPETHAITANSLVSSEQLDDTVIAVHDVSKMYRLYDRPQDRLKHQLLGRFGKEYGQAFWALQDVSFEVKRGEIVGIIGCNGSGKSTLLQLLAGVLQPTAGTIQVRGRVAALLELGSGFNPEYTGRENVFMNGAILGVSRAEMEDRFEQIASFAEIGDFIDQPVKVYSSGMFLRLAFAVAVNVDADILLIDEALAVGDVFFRQKCYQHLASLHERGVTIVLVTHAMLDVEEMCQWALLLHHGDVAFQGASAETVRQYFFLEQQHRLTEPPLASPDHSVLPVTPVVTGEACTFWPTQEAFLALTNSTEIANGWARCTGIAICDAHGQPCLVFQQGETANFFYEFELLRDIEVPIGGISIHNDKGLEVHGKNTLQYDMHIPARVTRGTRLRFQHEIALEIAIGEHTFMVGLASISQPDFASRSDCAYMDVASKIIYICQLPAVGQFDVVPRHYGKPVQLLHHGVANIPNQCRLSVITPPEENT